MAPAEPQLALLIFAALAPRLCQPGSYRLSGNLLVPDGSNGILVAADNVSLDLNGFSISPSVSGIGTGIDVPNHGAGSRPGRWRRLGPKRLRPPWEWKVPALDHR